MKTFIILMVTLTIVASVGFVAYYIGFGARDALMNYLSFHNKVAGLVGIIVALIVAVLGWSKSLGWWYQQPYLHTQEKE